jgi:SAM-dependent methyltransferase
MPRAHCSEQRLVAQVTRSSPILAIATLRFVVIEVLSCPNDKGDLVRVAESGGDLLCTRCSRTYPLRDGVMRFVDGDEYVGSFSYEWTVHRTTQLDDDSRRDSERTFREKTGLGPEDVSGKRVLDVGCGMGRFSDVILRWGGEVYAMDLSFGVDAAYANLGDRPGFHAVQASVFDLPFRTETFDIIFSLGVLDHTPDCERAFKNLPPLLRPGGQIAIWVYSAHTYAPESIDEKRDRLYRRYTSQMSPRTLHQVCRTLCRLRVKQRGAWHMALPGFLFHAVPRLHGNYPDYDRRVLDTFDWYSPQYQSKHSYPEVCRWFRETGLTDVEPLDTEVAVRGIKPMYPPG